MLIIVIKYGMEFVRLTFEITALKCREMINEAGRAMLENKIFRFFFSSKFQISYYFALFISSLYLSMGRNLNQDNFYFSRQLAIIYSNSFLAYTLVVIFNVG